MELSMGFLSPLTMRVYSLPFIPLRLRHKRLNDFPKSHLMFSGVLLSYARISRENIA